MPVYMYRLSQVYRKTQSQRQTWVYTLKQYIKPQLKRIPTMPYPNPTNPTSDVIQCNNEATCMVLDFTC
jgi:hypothetical protein